MQVWSLVSQKGGSGKSTLATQLAVYGGSLGLRVIILDLDPQASAAAWHLVRGEGVAPPVVRVASERLGVTLEAVRETGAFGLTIIDTAPHADKNAVEAIQLADVVLIPAQPGLFHTASLVDTAKLVDATDAYGRSFVIVNAVRGRGAEATAKSVADVARGLGLHVLPGWVHDRAAFAAAIDAGKGVTERGGDRDAAGDIVNLWGSITAVASAQTREQLNV